MVNIEYSNDCVGCPQGCINCGRKHAKYVYLVCDECGEEFGELYKHNGQELCEGCLLEEFERITEDDF